MEDMFRASSEWCSNEYTLLWLTSEIEVIFNGFDVSDDVNMKQNNLIIYTFICDVIWENPSHGTKYQIWVLGIIQKFELASFQNFLLGPSVILVSKVTDNSKPVKNKEKHLNYMV